VAHGCTPGGPWEGVEEVVVSPDGKNVYATAAIGSGMTIFDRAPATGTLTQKPGTAGCISFEQKQKGCQAGRALREPTGIVLSPDATTVYVAAGSSNAIDVFDRDPLTGALLQKSGSAGACPSFAPRVPARRARV
jgi:DNA-binding beta-propeller fold protein YncE